MSTARSALWETLRRVPLFNELSEEEVAAIAARVSVNSYAAGEVIFGEGDKGGDLLIVTDGCVRILKIAAEGRYQLLSIERAGSSLGEVSVFDEGRHSSTAIATVATTLVRLPGEQFRNLCLANPQVALKVIRVLGHRLRHLRKLVEDLSFGTVRDRLIAYLLRMAEEEGTAGPGGVEFPLAENNEELAGRLGTVRELISRNLGRLHGEGLILMRRRFVIIPDAARLRAEIRG